MPVSDLLARVRQDFGGEAIKVELEREDDDGAGVWVYEAKILTPDGRVLKAVYRAGDLALVSWKGRRERRLRSDDD
ncbi:PepSY domain-containing protein [Faunimonas sp. B44]|uniref:PepSY domain-containing protein n=1 Tax=Faunimonas sp. B44 TaxID=3461493 RepID=UPI004043B3D3